VARQNDFVLAPRRVVAAFAALLLPVLGLAGSMPRAAAAVSVLVIDGKGWGHGVGMAQDGAFWMAKSGANLQQILGHFYPGTGLSSATGAVRVSVRAPGPDAVLVFPTGGEVRDAPSGTQSPGFPVKVAPGGQVRIIFDGTRYTVSGGTPTGTAAGAGVGSGSDYHRVALRAARASSDGGLGITDSSTTTPLITLPGETSTTAPPSTSPPSTNGTTTTTAAPPPTTPTSPATSAPPASSTTTTTTPPGGGGSTPPPAAPDGSASSAASSQPLWAVPSSATGLVSLPERSRQYRGVIEALGAPGGVRLVNQLDVETYLKGMGEVRDPSWPQPALQTQAVAARTYALRAMSTGGELCDDDRCQVYLGAQAEYPAMNKAVDTTAKKVVSFGKSFASTVYSANGGGFSATTLEGFGNDSGLPYLKAGPYTTQDPMPWTVKVALTDVGQRFAYTGTVADVHVSGIGPSGRALSIVIDGTAGPKTVPGLKFASGLGLKSTLLSLHIESDETAPPPPAAADLIQAPPDQAAELAAPATELPDVPKFAPEVAGQPHVASRPTLHHGDGGMGIFLYLAVLVILTTAAIVATPQGRRLAMPVIGRIRENPWLARLPRWRWGRRS